MPKSIKNRVSLFYELGTLRKVARSHRQSLLTDDLSDNIASHSYRVTMIGWFLAKMEKADPYKVVMMCLWHDTGETRTGDQNWVNKKFVKSYEDEAASSQMENLDEKKELAILSEEYRKRESWEAKLAKDADMLDQVLLLREYSWQGNKEAASWLKDNEQIKRLFSKSAKKLAKEILVQKPSDWWTNLWTSERRK
jgi:putative hydrolases of HD superfamily